MEFANLEQSEITLFGKGNNEIQMKFPIPPELMYNLRIKRVGIQDLEVDVSSFPRFVPSLSWWNSNSQTYSAGSSNDTNVNNNGFSGQKNQLGYFFVIRKNDNTRACTSWVTWSNPNNINSANISNSTDQRAIYLTPYYYCYNFMDFLDMCQSAIVAGLTDVLGSAPTAVPTFLYYADSKTFKLTIPQSLGTTWNIEISQSLRDLFNFQVVPINFGSYTTPAMQVSTYQILWTNVSVAEEDFNASCKVSSAIYPFDLYMLECTNLPINTMNFVSTKTQILYQSDLRKKILKRWRKQYDAIERDQILTIEQQDEIDRLRPMLEDRVQDDKLTFVLWVRTSREQEYIEWTMPQNQQIKFLLNTYSLA